MSRRSRYVSKFILVRVGWIFLFVVLLMVPRGASAVVQKDSPISPAQPNSKSQYAKGKIIVKFKSEGNHAVTECVHCLLAQKRAFQTATADQSDSLDRLNTEAKVKSARALFYPRCGLITSQAQERYRQKIKEVKNRFLQRTQRAPQDAILPDLANIYVLEVPEDADIEELVRRYQADPHVEYAQPNYLMKLQTALPNDTYVDPDQNGTWSIGAWGQNYEDLWGLKKLQASQAWDQTQGQGITVAVIDTGLDYNHPDIATNVWKNPNEIPGNGLDDDNNGFIDDIRGWDFANNDNDPLDGHGHGTHVAGTIAAVGNNGLGIIGVVPKAKLMALKGLGNDGSGTANDLADAIVYAAQQGADVLNNSWGCDVCPSNPVEEEAVRTAQGLGAVVVFAAGNSSDDVINRSPQNMTTPKPVVVSATTQEDLPTFFTSFGVLVDVAAPGGGTDIPPPTIDPFRNILSLKASSCDPLMCNPSLIVGTNYVRQAGTSMAAPHVAGVAALVLAARSTFTNEEVRQILRASADDVASPGFDVMTGAGRLNAARALAVTSVLRVNITAPASGTMLDPQAGSVTITGTAAGPNFKQYELFYGKGSAPTEWVSIGQPSFTPVEGGVLGVWPIAGLTVGSYTLRLVATTLDSLQFQAFVPVVVELPVQRITTDPATKWNVKISGDRIVWRDHRHGENADIYLYDLATNKERRITTDPADQRLPAIAGNRIVWFDNRNATGPFQWDIYGCVYDPGSGTCPERRITTQTISRGPAAISGSWVVWADVCRDGRYGICLYDFTTNTERRITTDAAGPRIPDISGNRIVWLDFRDKLFGEKIFFCTYDPLTTACPEQSITESLATQLKSNLHIAGNRIVWQAIPLPQDNNNFNIYLYDISTNTEQQITTGGPAFHGDPAISGDRIVWDDFRNGNADIYLYDLATNTERQITAHPTHQNIPAISGNQIVWVDFRNGNADIYLAKLSMDIPKNAFRGEYFDNHDFTNLMVSRNTGAAIDFDWGTGSPDPAIAPDTFSVRWEGDWDFPITATYRLTATTDDGMRIWIDGALILDKWFDQAPTTYIVNQPVTAGVHRVKVEYYEYQGGAVAKLFGELAPPNNAPVLAPINNKTVQEGQPLSFTITASDPDGDALSYSASPLPTGASFNTSTRTFSWTPGFDQAGNYPVTFTVSDGSLSDSKSITISVQDVPQPDLVITAVSGPSSAQRRQYLAITTTVANQGAVTAVTDSYRGISVGLYLSKDATITTADTKLGSRTVTSLAPGASSTASVNVKIPSRTVEGTYYLGAIADSTNQVKESNETNNAKTGNAITIY